MEDYSDFSDDPDPKTAIDDNLQGISFSPPLWEQRLDKFREILFSLKVVEVCDLGCGSGKLISQLCRCKGPRRIYGVDIDKFSLEEAAEECRPNMADFHFPRKHELKVSLFHGSILDPCELIPYQIQCVTLGEVIEHIYPESVPILTENIFKYIYPKYAIVSTPNREFNVYFPDPKHMRNYDHKFEWTRKEFEEWSHKVCKEYGYEVEFTGVGFPIGYQDHGFCTQFAVFRKQKFSYEKRPCSVKKGQFTNYEEFLYEIQKYDDFKSKFINSLYYSCNLAKSWNYLGNEDPIPLTEVFRVPTICVLCDGSLNRLRELILLYKNCGSYDFIYSQAYDTLTLVLSSDESSDYSSENEDI
ncbi:HENMT1 [Blepharisma stoltei]|uniref:Small RNA 2'-O-methyltransferase n=1 Tax=Blepharisma stoltei TaxID=1481888 RepID=A0AAU9KA93_9CILI|nr:unnamed protein product [Blepharisma stoltei]